jgi:hypothetical protein
MLVVTGKLQVADSFQFDGIVIVLGDVQMSAERSAIAVVFCLATTEVEQQVLLNEV